MKETVKRYQTTIKDLRYISSDVIELTLKFTETFLFHPGQYIWLILPNFVEGGRRAFSIASAPNIENEIILIIRHNKKSEYKNGLAKLTSGDQVFVEGPFGKSFSIKVNTTFVTEGVSVAPFLSLLRGIQDNGIPYKINLLSLHHPSDHLLFEEELRALSLKHENFHYKSALQSTAENSLAELIKQDQTQEWYLLGSETVVQTVQHFLIWNGVSEELIHFGQQYPRSPQDVYLTVDDIHNKNGLVYFKYIVEQSSSHIVITDIDGRILYANSAAQRLTGYTFDEMYGQTPRLWGGLMPDEIYKQFWKTIKTDKLPYKGELTNRKKNGTTYRAIASVTPIFNGDQKLIAFVGLEEDITEHLNIERDLQKKTTEVEKLNKLMIGRELKMVELKKEIKQLKEMKYEK